MKRVFWFLMGLCVSLVSGAVLLDWYLQRKQEDYSVLPVNTIEQLRDRAKKGELPLLQHLAVAHHSLELHTTSEEGNQFWDDYTSDMSPDEYLDEQMVMAVINADMQTWEAEDRTEKTKARQKLREHRLQYPFWQFVYSFE